MDSWKWEAISGSRVRAIKSLSDSNHDLMHSIAKVDAFIIANKSGAITAAIGLLPRLSASDRVIVENLLNLVK